jgi:transposase
VLEKRELGKAIAEGLSVAQLAEVFGCSKGSVRYWLQKYELRTVNPSGRSLPGVRI